MLDSVTIDNLVWIGIAFCITQSALFSGLNLAFFSLSRMRLQVEAKNGVAAALKILALREDSNMLLTTVLWGNVGINVLLTLLSNSVMSGVTAFLFSTLLITFFGEICPQAYFSRNAMKMASALVPIIRFYQYILYPVARPSAKMLDLWLGRESVDYFRESDLKEIINAHIESESAEVDQVEGQGAINFLAIDDVFVKDEGQPIDEKSIIALPSKIDFPILPAIERSIEDPFLSQVNESKKSWVVLTNENGAPLMVIDADGLLRDALFVSDETFDPYNYCHRPVVVKNNHEPLGQLISQLKFNPQSQKKESGVILNDVILLWSEEKRIITGTDLLGRLLHGVASEHEH